MSTSSLIFDIFGRDVSATKALRGVAREAEHSSHGFATAFKKAATGVTLAGVAAVAQSIRMAGNFQFQMQRLVTAAGESEANLKMVSAGVLAIARETGTSTSQLAAGMYVIESAGFHGAAGLTVLRAAAKGAKIENADLGEVANAVSSAMVDYHMRASQSAAVMNTFIAAVAHGKTTLAGMAEAFVNVGAAGAQAHIPMADLTAAIATMTMHGTDAARAGTYLRQVIGQLESPSMKARKVMEGLGLDANKVGLTLSSGPGGLARAISMLETAITKHLTPAGLVAFRSFKNAKDATGDWQKVLADLPPTTATTFAALSQMTGGVKSLQGFLQLGGENLKTFRDNTKAVSDAASVGGQKIEGWDATQRTFNVQLDKLVEGVKVTAIEIGTKLLPTVTSLVGWMSRNADTIKNVTIAVVAMFAAYKGYMILHAVALAFKKVYDAATYAQLGARAAGRETSTAGARMSTVSGVLGGLSLALGIGVTAWALYKQAQQRARQKVEDLSNAISADSDALGRNTREVVINRLQKEGMYDQGLKLGINQKMLTDAAMGNTRALAVLRMKIYEATGGLDVFTYKGYFAAVGMGKQGDAAAFLATHLADLSGDLGKAQHAADNKAAADGRATTATKQASHAVDELVTSLTHVPPTKATRVTANTLPALASLRSLKDYFTSMQYLNLTIGVNKVNAGSSGHHAQGAGFFTGGWTHINEQGGEMAYLPNGSKIIPASSTASQLGSGGDTIVNLSMPGRFYGSPAEFGREVKTALEAIANQGVKLHIVDAIR